MNLWLLAGCATAAYAAWKLLRFTRADGDATLLSKCAPPPGAFAGRVVWIVGASQGLGEALARRWAALGARLILTARSEAGLAAVRDACLAHLSPEDISLLPLDVTVSEEQLEAAVAAAFAAFDGAGVDVLVHNVGASQHAAVEDTSVAVAAQLLNLNLAAPLALARAALPAMLHQGRGRHVVVASMSAVVPSPGQAVYAATKAGLRVYFASIASELADRGVAATVCCPGPFEPRPGGPPRSVFGPRGRVAQAHTGLSSNKVPVERAAELIVTAAHHGLPEVWIARHPVLLMGYLMQYWPWLGTRVLARVGPARAAQLRDGSGSGYDVAAMLRR